MEGNCRKDGMLNVKEERKQGMKRGRRMEKYRREKDIIERRPGDEERETEMTHFSKLR